MVSSVPDISKKSTYNKCILKTNNRKAPEEHLKGMETEKNLLDNKESNQEGKVKEDKGKKQEENKVKSFKYVLMDAKNQNFFFSEDVEDLDTDNEDFLASDEDMLLD